MVRPRSWRTYDLTKRPAEPVSGSYAETKADVLKSLAAEFVGQSVLDVGTDLGLAVHFLPDSISEFVGVDTDISEAEEFRLPNRSEITFVQRDILTVPFAEWEQRFDISLALSLMHVIVPEFKDFCKWVFPERPADFTLDDYFSLLKYYTKRLLIFDCIGWKTIDSDRILRTASNHFGRAEVLAERNDPNGFSAVVFKAGE